MKIRCIAIDDEPLALAQICSYIEKTPFLELTASCRDAFEAMKCFAETPADLLFVDINMPGLNGMELAKTLHNTCMIIFTTAYSDYAVEGFRVDAVDYLMKPIGYADFLQAANKANERWQAKHPAVQESLDVNTGFLFVKSEYRTLRINIREITYIEGMREYVRIHLIHGKPVMTLLSMKALEDKLPGNMFMRVHRSYIVNLEKISVIERNRIIFGDIYIPVGEQYKEQFQEYVDKNFL